MKTQNLATLFVFFAVVGCGTSTTKNETHLDSISVESTSTTSTSSTLVAVNNFPHYRSSELLTDDPLEAEITAGIDELIAANINLNFLTLQSHYLREREYDGEHGTVTETEDETETWFFDLSFKLKAYSKSYYRDGEGRDTKTTIQLFSNDTLSAMTERWDQDNQVGMMYYSKFLASKCPNCGVDVRREAGAPGVVLTNTEAFEDRFTNLSELIGRQNTDWTNAEESYGMFVMKENIEQWPDGETNGKLTVEYTMSRDLFSYYQFTNFIDLFGNSNAKIPDKTARFYLDSDGTGSYSTKDILESEVLYFLLYKKFKQVGQGVEELYAASFTKDAQQKSNILLGSSFPSTGPDGGGEEYDYKYDPEKRILTVTNTVIEWDESWQKEKGKETTTKYKLDSEGTIFTLGK